MDSPCGYPWKFHRFSQFSYALELVRSQGVPTYSIYECTAPQPGHTSPTARIGKVPLERYCNVAADTSLKYNVLLNMSRRPRFNHRGRVRWKAPESGFPMVSPLFAHVRSCTFPMPSVRRYCTASVPEAGLPRSPWHPTRSTPWSRPGPASWTCPQASNRRGRPLRAPRGTGARE